MPFSSSEPIFNKATLDFSSLNKDLNSEDPIIAKSIKFLSLHSIFAPKSKTTLIPFLLGHKPDKAGLSIFSIIFKFNLAITKKNSVKNIHLSSKRDWHVQDFTAYITTKKISPLRNNLSPDIVPNLFDPAKCMKAGNRFIAENNLYEDKFSLLILGGNGIGYKYDKNEWDEILKNFSDFCMRSNTKQVFITSPRTPIEVENIIQSRYDTSISVLFHSENKRGSFSHLFYIATNIFVTEDSSTMLSEAISSGKRIVCVYPERINAPKKYTEIIQKYEALNFIKRRNIKEICDTPFNEAIDISSAVNQSLAEFNKLLVELLSDQ